MLSSNATRFRKPDASHIRAMRFPLSTGGEFLAFHLRRKDSAASTMCMSSSADQSRNEMKFFCILLGSRFIPIQV